MCVLRTDGLAAFSGMGGGVGEEDCAEMAHLGGV